MISSFMNTYSEKVNVEKIENEYKKARKQGVDLCNKDYIDDTSFADNYEMRKIGIEALESGNIPSNVIATNRIYFDEIGLLWMITELYKENAIDNRKFSRMWKDACDVVLYAKHQILKDNAIEGWNILHNYYRELNDIYFAKFY